MNILFNWNGKWIKVKYSKTVTTLVSTWVKSHGKHNLLDFSLSILRLSLNMHLLFGTFNDCVDKKRWVDGQKRAKLGPHSH